jgi:hypothetical protein
VPSFPSILASWRPREVPLQATVSSLLTSIRACSVPLFARGQPPSPGPADERRFFQASAVPGPPAARAPCTGAPAQTAPADGGARPPRVRSGGAPQDSASDCRRGAMTERSPGTLSNNAKMAPAARANGLPDSALWAAFKDMRSAACMRMSCGAGSTPRRCVRYNSPTTARSCAVLPRSLPMSSGCPCRMVLRRTKALNARAQEGPNALQQKVRYGARKCGVCLRRKSADHQACVPRFIGITFLGSSQWSIRSAQCCISFVREPIRASGPCFL